MSAIFQRPVCDMGRAYDYSFRPVVGDPDVGSGGGCDEMPHRVEMFAAGTDPTSATAEWQPFGLCAEHESQLRGYDARVRARGMGSRFRASPATPRGVL
ncbi:MAG TPA: hypothetical protein VN842_02780 [Thermoplasmata archaeon]|nr:hypothetical protein [Thermoplasmata archaeon]